MNYKIVSSRVLTVKDPFKAITKGKTARKYKKALFVIQTHIYPNNILVSVNQTKEELAKSMVKSFKQSTEEQYLNGALAGEYGGRTIFFDGGGIVVHFPHLDNCSFCHGLISHEAFHAVEAVCDYTGVKHDKSTSSEAFAYLIGYVVEEIHKKLK